MVKYYKKTKVFYEVSTIMRDVKKWQFLDRLPTVKRELSSLVKNRSVTFSDVSELRIRTLGRCSAVIRGDRIGLLSQVTREDMRVLFSELCDGSLYAHRDTVQNGYITLSGGIRVGVCGEARYEGGAFVGVGEVYSLVFRIPTGKSCVADELFSFWQTLDKGLLIYSPSGVGKTSALRSLALKIASGKGSKNVAVVDERREFLPEEYMGASVDVLRGYKREDGIEIALRTLSSEVVIIDELGGEEEMKRFIQFANSGIKILATAHARNREELLCRSAVRVALNEGTFDGIAGIYMDNGVRRVKTEVYEP